MTAGVAGRGLLTLGCGPATLARGRLHGREAMRSRRDIRRDNDARAAAGNGLLDRRVFLKGGAAAAGAFMAFASETAAAPPEIPPGMTMAGAGMSPYGSPAGFEREV